MPRFRRVKALQRLLQPAHGVAGRVLLLRERSSPERRVMVLLQSSVFPLRCLADRAGLFLSGQRWLKNLPREQCIGILPDDAPVGLVPAGPLKCDVQIGHAGSQMAGRYVPERVSGLDGDTFVRQAAFSCRGTGGRSCEHSRICDRWGRLPAGVEG